MCVLRAGLRVTDSGTNWFDKTTGLISTVFCILQLLLVPKIHTSPTLPPSLAKLALHMHNVQSKTFVVRDLVLL